MNGAVLSFGESVVSGSLFLALPIALFAGLVSFLSPCVLPLLPGYLGYFSSLAATDKQLSTQTLSASSAAATALKPAAPSDAPARSWRLVGSVTLFVLGFSAVFITLGIMFSAAGARFAAHADTLTRVAGVVIILMGIIFAGGFASAQTTKRLKPVKIGGPVGAVALGGVFGIGWTPCIGPTLTAVLSLTLSESNATRGLWLIIAYCVGLGLPFIAAAIFVDRSAAVTRWLTQHGRTVQLIGGILLVVLGLLMVTGAWNSMLSWIGTLVDSTTWMV